MTDGANDGKTQDVTPIYIRSKEHAWIPAGLVEVSGTQATVVVPSYGDDEQEILQLPASVLEKSGVTSKTTTTTIIDLNDYDARVLPLQNADGNDNRLSNWDDMVGLPYLHEPAILYNLKQRHLQQVPYTRTGDIVIAINPYQWLDHLYTKEQQLLYAHTLVWKPSADRDPRSGLAPHVYEVSALAYKGMAVDGYHQSILVSGESGAGKTETVKICMHHMASLQQGPKSNDNNNNDNHQHQHCSQTIVQRILDSSPLLEAFGNAQTRRNDNSSRFGKYTQLQFDRGAVATDLLSSQATLAGSIVEVYLLEKARVVNHAPEERTFHVLYQLLAAPEETKLDIWDGLAGTTNESFTYVGTTTTHSIEGKTDAEHFQRVVQALKLIGIEGETLRTLFRSLCVVLQLGNITFQADHANEERAAVASREEFTKLSELMGVSEDHLESSLSQRTFMARGEVCTVYLNALNAKDSCHAWAKEVYGKTFLWLVREINTATSAQRNYSRPSHVGQCEHNDKIEFGIIGLLDIFGFESFPHNGFEQLCINYANEKLQQKFTQDIFRSVQAEYVEEGLDLVDITYQDNDEVLKLLEGRGGLLDLLNEECLMPKPSDANFVRKVVAGNETSPSLIVENAIHKERFGILHYAGKVTYSAEEFTIRNKDTMAKDLKECASTCSNSIIAQEFTRELGGLTNNNTDSTNGIGPTETPKRSQSGMSNETLWSRYREQLKQLMGDLRKTRSRYIRCIKPNVKKQPNVLEHKTTVEQLRYAGIIAGITISRSAFPNRLPNTTVLARYKSIWNKKLYPSQSQLSASDEEKRRADCTAMLTGLLKERVETKEGGKVVQAFVVGKTRTYFRSGALEVLQSKRQYAFDSLAVTIQTAARAWLIWHRDRERRERFAQFRREHQLLQTELCELQATFEEAEQYRKQTLQSLEERLERAMKVSADLNRKTEEVTKSEAMKLRQQMTELQQKIDANDQEFMRIQGISERVIAKHDEVKRKHDEVKAENQRLLKQKEGEEKAKKLKDTIAKTDGKNYNKMRSEIAQLERENQELEREAKKKKFQQLEWSKKRFDARNKLLELVAFITKECKDADLVVEISALASECEKNATSELDAVGVKA